MTEAFNDRLLRVVTERESHLCVGLDPDYEKIRATMWEQVQAAMRDESDLEYIITGAMDMFKEIVGNSEETEGESEEIPLTVKELACKLVIGACEGIAVAFKPNAAFFEPDTGAIMSLADEVADLGMETLSIFDGKRGDIGNTSLQYARGILQDCGFDAMTVNPLMGYDSIEPFIRDPEHGIFLLCLTSNPGAQDFLLQGELYKRIAEKAVSWNTNGNIGLVVGATQAEHAAAVREIAPELPLLIPGIGAQGGSLGEIMDAIGARTNRRFLINASRSIMFTDQKPTEEVLVQHHLGSVAYAAIALSEEINRHLQ
jgi:orotidine 5'-phosphate decarboxylase subfamily 2